MATPQLLPSGPLFTSGNQIVDQNNNPVRIACIGWNGGNVRGGVPDGLYAVNYQTLLNQVKSIGFNCIRLLTCDAWVLNNDYPSSGSISNAYNPTLTGLSCLQVLTAIITYCGTIGLRVIVDSHNNEGYNPFNYGANQFNGLWYDVGGASDGTDGTDGSFTPNVGTVSDTLFLQAWQMRANAWKGLPAILGYDIRNEPNINTGGSWGDGNYNTDYRLMYQRVGNAILAIDNRPLIICEGVQNYHSTYYTGTAPDGINYGNGTVYDGHSGDLTNVRVAPVQLNVANKVLYSVHEYPQETTGVAEDSAGQTKINQMNAAWGYLVKENTAAVWIGEMGSPLVNATAAASTAWCNMMIAYMGGSAANGPTFTGAQQGIGWDWWDLAVDEGGNVPFGILTAWSGGSARPAQYAIYSQMFFFGSTGAITTPTPTPAPSPTPIVSKTAAVLSFLNSISGTHTLSGQFVERGPIDPVTQIYNTTGKYVGLLGGDYYYFNAPQGNTDTSFNSIAIPYWQAGGLITISLSMSNPDSGGGVQDGNPCNFSQLLTAGTYQYNNWLANIQAVGAGLQELQNNGVTVLLRIYHENNGNWFWWGTQNASSSQFIQLWQNTYTYFKNTMNLTNLLFVWAINAGTGSLTATYPGDAYVDVVGFDLYSDNVSDGDSTYNALTAHNKPIAMCEFGSGNASQGDPNFDCRNLINTISSDMPKITWFLCWWDGNAGGHNYDWSLNAYQYTTQALALARTYNRGQFTIGGTPTPAPTPTPTPNPTPTPTPSSGTSPNGTIITTVGPVITDANGNTWGISSGGLVVVNGTADGTTANVIELAYISGLIWQENTAGNWYYKAVPTDTWTQGASPIGNAPVASPSGTIINSVGPAITDSNGNLWSISSTAQVVLNGVIDATTSGVIELAYIGGKIWQENTALLWYYKVLPTDQWLPTTGTSVSPIVVTPAPSPTPTPTPPPTNIWNIHSGLATWAPNTKYALGNRVNNQGVAYQCVVAGTSAAMTGPTGTGANIVDGTAHWAWVSIVDFVTVGAAFAQLPATFTNNVTWEIWNETSQTTPGGVPFFDLVGHATGSYSLTLTAAPSDSIRTYLKSQSVPLAINPTAATCFLQPLDIGAGINYCVVEDPTVIIDGLQFQDPCSTSNSTILASTTTNTSLIIRNCIFDGYSQTGGAIMLDLGTTGTVLIYNCLIIDRQAAASGTYTFGVNSTVTSFRLVNCTIIAPNAPTNAVLFGGGFSGGIVKNCAVFGYGTTGDGGYTFDHSATNQASWGFGTDGGNNVFSITAANCFVNPTSDWRTLATSPLLNVAAIDLTDIPTADDIAGVSRTQGSGWDIGCYERLAFTPAEIRPPPIKFW